MVLVPRQPQYCGHFATFHRTKDTSFTSPENYRLGVPGCISTPRHASWTNGKHDPDRSWQTKRLGPVFDNGAARLFPIPILFSCPVSYLAVDQGRTSTFSSHLDRTSVVASSGLPLLKTWPRARQLPHSPHLVPNIDGPYSPLDTTSVRLRLFD